MNEYHIGDCREPIDEGAAVAAVDLAWARPHRNGVHVTYPTHSPPELWEFVDAAFASVKDGGWLLFDADDWLLPRLIDYIREEYGDVAATYSGGGYRRTGTVVYTGHPGAGHYYTNGGYHVVMAHKGETDRTSSVPAKQVCPRPDTPTKWGTPKPVEPYSEWIPSVMESDELLYVPCAGTAPAALALETEWGDDARYICVDSEPEAKEAFEKRRENATLQRTL